LLSFYHGPCLLLTMWYLVEALEYVILIGNSLSNK
jgi:hypothetical protein